MIRYKGTMSRLATISVIGLWKGLFSLMSNVGGLGLGGGGDSVGRGPPNHTQTALTPRQTDTH